jgi:hypothetical protein
MRAPADESDGNDAEEDESEHQDEEHEHAAGIHTR